MLKLNVSVESFPISNGKEEEGGKSAFYSSGKNEIFTFEIVESCLLCCFYPLCATEQLTCKKDIHVELPDHFKRVLTTVTSNCGNFILLCCIDSFLIFDIAHEEFEQLHFQVDSKHSSCSLVSAYFIHRDFIIFQYQLEPLYPSVYYCSYKNKNFRPIKPVAISKSDDIFMSNDYFDILDSHLWGGKCICFFRATLSTKYTLPLEGVNDLMNNTMHQLELVLECSFFDISDLNEEFGSYKISTTFHDCMKESNLSITCSGDGIYVAVSYCSTIILHDTEKTISNRTIRTNGEILNIHWINDKDYFIAQLSGKLCAFNSCGDAIFLSTNNSMITSIDSMEREESAILTGSNKQNLKSTFFQNFQSKVCTFISYEDENILLVNFQELLECQGRSRNDMLYMKRNQIANTLSSYTECPFTSIEKQSNCDICNLKLSDLFTTLHDQVRDKIVLSLDVWETKFALLFNYWIQNSRLLFFCNFEMYFYDFLKPFLKIFLAFLNGSSCIENLEPMEVEYYLLSMLLPNNINFFHCFSENQHAFAPNCEKRVLQTFNTYHSRIGRNRNYRLFKSIWRDFFFFYSENNLTCERTNILKPSHGQGGECTAKNIVECCISLQLYDFGNAVKLANEAFTRCIHSSAYGDDIIILYLMSAILFSSKLGIQPYIPSPIFFSLKQYQSISLNLIEIPHSQVSVDYPSISTLFDWSEVANNFSVMKQLYEHSLFNHCINRDSLVEIFKLSLLWKKNYSESSYGLKSDIDFFLYGTLDYSFKSGDWCNGCRKFDPIDYVNFKSMPEENLICFANYFLYQLRSLYEKAPLFSEFQQENYIPSEICSQKVIEEIAVYSYSPFLDALNSALLGIRSSPVNGFSITSGCNTASINLKYCETELIRCRKAVYFVSKLLNLMQLSNWSTDCFFGTAMHNYLHEMRFLKQIYLPYWQFRKFSKKVKVHYFPNDNASKPYIFRSIMCAIWAIASRDMLAIADFNFTFLMKNGIHKSGIVFSMKSSKSVFEYKLSPESDAYELSLGNLVLNISRFDVVKYYQAPNYNEVENQKLLLSLLTGAVKLSQQIKSKWIISFICWIFPNRCDIIPQVRQKFAVTIEQIQSNYREEIALSNETKMVMKKNFEQMLHRRNSSFENEINIISMIINASLDPEFNSCQDSIVNYISNSTGSTTTPRSTSTISKEDVFKLLYTQEKEIASKMKKIFSKAEISSESDNMVVERLISSKRKDKRENGINYNNEVHTKSTIISELAKKTKKRSASLKLLNVSSSSRLHSISSIASSKKPSKEAIILKDTDTHTTEKMLENMQIVDPMLKKWKPPSITALSYGHCDGVSHESEYAKVNIKLLNTTNSKVKCVPISPCSFLDDNKKKIKNTVSTPDHCISKTTVKSSCIQTANIVSPPECHLVLGGAIETVQNVVDAKHKNDSGLSADVVESYMFPLYVDLDLEKDNTIPNQQQERQFVDIVDISITDYTTRLNRTSRDSKEGVSYKDAFSIEGQKQQDQVDAISIKPAVENSTCRDDCMDLSCSFEDSINASTKKCSSITMDNITSTIVASDFVQRSQKKLQHGAQALIEQELQEMDKKLAAIMKRADSIDQDFNQSRKLLERIEKLQAQNPNNVESQSNKLEAQFIEEQLEDSEPPIKELLEVNLENEIEVEKVMIKKKKRTFVRNAQKNILSARELLEKLAFRKGKKCDGFES